MQCHYIYFLPPTAAFIWAWLILASCIIRTIDITEKLAMAIQNGENIYGSSNSEDQSFTVAGRDQEVSAQMIWLGWSCDSKKAETSNWTLLSLTISWRCLEFEYKTDMSWTNNPWCQPWELTQSREMSAKAAPNLEGLKQSSHAATGIRFSTLIRTAPMLCTVVKGAGNVS